MTSLIGGSESNSNVIIFDTSKNEKKLNDEFKVLQRKLKPKWKFVELVEATAQRLIIDLMLNHVKLKMRL